MNPTYDVEEKILEGIDEMITKAYDAKCMVTPLHLSSHT